MNAASHTERRANYLWFHPLPAPFFGEAATETASLSQCLLGFEAAVAVFLNTECASCHTHAFEAHCRLQRVFRFADNMVAGLRLADIGSYALRFELALFAAEDEDGRSKPAATAELVHVMKPAEGGKPQAMEAGVKAGLLRFACPASA